MLLHEHPHLIRGEHPDGHGGHHLPPPGALTYRPSAEVAALVRARDRHCRFPSCTTSAEQCQLDHIVAFDHQRPDAGGWTVGANLQCVCRFHHQLKTTGLWRAVALPGAVMLWTGSYGTRHVTLPDGGLTATPAASLTPAVGAGPEHWHPPERSHRDEPPPF